MDGNKGRCFRSKDEDAQARKYDGYNKCHFYSTMVMTDIFGRYIWVETVNVDGEKDKSLYIASDVVTDSTRFLSSGEIGLADIGYKGFSRLEYPDKKSRNLQFPFRSIRNKAIIGVIMVNEWAMGYVNNRYQIFLGRLIYSEEL